MLNWKSEWKKIAAQVTEYIRSDSFPDRIRPLPLREAVRAYPCAGGKRLRPLLLSWSCGLFGGDPECALPAAAATEIYHNWTLVHDDIIDCDDLRRGMPTTHAALKSQAGKQYGIDPESSRKFGTDFAILAGDLQQAWAMDALLRLNEHGVSAETVLFLAGKMERVLACDLISGEALDVEFAPRGFQNVTETEVRDMISGKTGAILRYCMQAGAVIAKNVPSFDTKDIQNAGEFAEQLGLAFQLRDDYLGIFGDEKKFGKPLGSDFQESKPTILLLAAMKQGTPAQKKRLPELMGLAEYPQNILDEIRSILKDSGAETAVRREIDACSGYALELLGQLPANPFRDCLAALTQEMTERNV